MSKQHDGALRLLAVIQSAQLQHRLLTYSSAALELGRNEDHARAVAQMCDLLDAAAAYANVPLLALTAVRTKSGDINPKAWKGKGYEPEMRERIIKRSLTRTFSDGDFEAIRRSLHSLSGLGNHAAWEMVRREVSDDVLFGVIAAEVIDGAGDAIEDIGADKPERHSSTTTHFARDPKVRQEVERRSRGCCELCGKQGFLRDDGTRYVETHHIIALAKEGPDRLSNVIGLCADHHREAHFGARAGEIEKEMMAVLQRLLKQ